MPERRLLAAVDLGSNSFRLLIGRVEHSSVGVQVQALDNLKEPVRLAAGLTPEGMIDVPAQQLIAGLFGYGLRSLGASGAPVATSSLAVAAQTGGGVVFAVALVLPTLVYLRGCCAVYLALQDAPSDDAAL